MGVSIVQFREVWYTLSLADKNEIILKISESLHFLSVIFKKTINFKNFKK